MQDIEDSERRVEAMIARGKEIVAEAVAEHHPVAVIAAFSGGNDSIVSTHFAAEEFGDVVVFHADTQIGVKASKEHVNDCFERFRWTGYTGRPELYGPPKYSREGGRKVPFDKAKLARGEWKDGKTAYEEYVFNFGFAGKAQHHRMCQRLKERPLRALTRNLQKKRGDRILIVSGIRHDESAVRAGYKRAIQRDVTHRSHVWVNPFYWNDALDFEAYRQEFGLPRNPVKAKLGVSGECLCGAFAKPHERRAIREVDPDVDRYIDELEAEVCSVFPWKWGEHPPKGWRERSCPFDDSTGFDPMCVGCARRPAVLEYA